LHLGFPLTLTARSAARQPAPQLAIPGISAPQRALR
jgi:hypothetical protein